MRSMTALTMMALLGAASPHTISSKVEMRATVSMHGSLDSLQEYFNQHHGRLRFVTLLSPT